jgi:acetyltransferase-like isoleucine patch superfamily enzyme/dTDP-4-dehydrorhamnose 3,5-epimerase-like enzyme
MTAKIPMSDFFLHPRGICESTQVGAGTKIWAFAHVLPTARIGRDCNICDHVFIENDVIVGDRVTIKCGVQLWNGVQLADDVFVGPNATFTNDPFPRSKRHLAQPVRTFVGPGASIGANATILPGVEIGAGAMVGAGSVVARSVPAHAIVMGNPARITGYADSPMTPEKAVSAAIGTPSRVAGVRLLDFRAFEDMRGALHVGEFPADLPFAPRRFFVVHNVPGSEVRGEHAHLECQQILVCLQGQVNVVVDDGDSREEFRLSGPAHGLYIPPLIWATQHRYTADTMVLVLASHPYSPEDYIRNYSAYLEQMGRGRGDARREAPGS